MATPSNYIAISRRSLDMEDYIDLARRHSGWIVGPTLAGLVVASCVALYLPNVFVSIATMRITPSQISDTIVAATINQQLTGRIEQMEQDILSRTSLSNIIQDPRLDLYKADRATKPIEDVIEIMKNRDIKITINDPTGGLIERRGASSFNISFAYSDAHKAQQVVQTLVTKFNDSNQSSQRTTQSIVTEFVHDELSETRANLNSIDDALTKFRVENAGKLPENAQTNIAQMTSEEQRLASVNEALSRLDQQKIQYDQHIDTLTEQLHVLDLLGKESEANGAPAMRQQNERLTAMNRTITDTESQLAQLHQIFRPGYPDIRDAENRLGVLKKQRDDLQKEQDAEEAKPAEAKPKKTNYQQLESATALQGQIDATKALISGQELERRNMLAEQKTITEQLKVYQGRLSATSSIEAKYADLVRDEKAATAKLQIQENNDDRNKQQASLLQRRAGEQLEVLDAPSLPIKASKPDRWLVVGAGLALSFILGLAMAGVQEARDTSLKNLKDVRAYTNLPVLSSIPLLENSMLVRRKRRLSYLAWSAGIIIGILCVGAALYYHMTTLT